MLELKSLEWESIASNGRLTAQLIAEFQNGDDSALGELYQQLCHQNTVSTIAFVAVPHLVSMAQNSSKTRHKAILLSIVGSVVASRHCYSRSSAKLRDDWKEDFMQACDAGRILAAETLTAVGLDADDSLLLIAGLAALHGHFNLALLLDSGLDFYCPKCGKTIVFGEDED